MIENDEFTLKERLDEVMRGADAICHKLINRNGIMGVKFDQGIYKGKFIPLNTCYDIDHLNLFIVETIVDMREECNNTDNMINLFTNDIKDNDEDENITESSSSIGSMSDADKKKLDSLAAGAAGAQVGYITGVKDDIGLGDVENKNDDMMDLIRKLNKNIEKLRRESIRGETEKILYVAECCEYFDYIVSADNEFRGVVFYNPQKSDTQVIKLEDSLLSGEVEEYYNKLQDCIDIVIEYEDDLADVYARHCMKMEDR